MKWHCNSCDFDFTTFSMDETTLVKFDLMDIKRMKCQHCWAKSVVLHEDCRGRQVYKGNGWEVFCDGCPSRFNCFTGNIDDGDKCDVIHKDTREEQIEKAKEHVRKLEREKLAEEHYKTLNKLHKAGFSIYITNNKTYVKFRNTTWKIDSDDLNSIFNELWNTPKTLLIKKVLMIHSVDYTNVSKVLNFNLIGKGFNRGNNDSKKG